MNINSLYDSEQYQLLIVLNNHLRYQIYIILMGFEATT